MAKPELLLTIGLPASGKTSFAKAWQAELLRPVYGQRDNRA